MKIEPIPGLPAPIIYFKNWLIAAVLLSVFLGAESLWAEATASGAASEKTAVSESGKSEETADRRPTSGSPVLAPTEVPTPDSGPAFVESTEASQGESSKLLRKRVNKLEVGDKVTVKIYPEDQYIKGGGMEVSSEGTITLPLLGRINVQGLSVRETEQKITEILSKDYLVNPVVVVEVADRLIEKKYQEKEKKSLSILGQVQKPGPYDFPATKKMTLLELISKAGGFTDVANAKNIKVIRKKGGKTSAIHANAESIIAGKDPDIELEPDDVVHVGESFF